MPNSQQSLPVRSRSLNDGTPPPRGSGRTGGLKPSVENRLFLSGPMTGLPDFNRPLFSNWAAHYRQLGHCVWSPAEISPKMELTREDYQRVNLSELTKRSGITCNYYDAVLALPEWWDSIGSKLEIAIAVELGIDVLDVETAMPVQFAGIYHVAIGFKRARRVSA